MKINILPGLLLFFILIFNSACSNSDKTASQYNSDSEFVDCYDVKREFIIYVKNNIDDIIPILIREMSKSDGDNEISTQRVLDGVQSLSFMNKWEKYEKILKENCPEVHRKFQEEVSVILLTALAKSSEF